MGREIRRVPKGWEHPKNVIGEYQPMFDQSYREACEEYMEGLRRWEDGKREEVNERFGSDYEYYWEYEGMPPDYDYYRTEEWPEEPTCYQIYETVSEGTPVSPVFETKQELIDWLVKEGHSRKAARGFAESGWAPSAMFYLDKGIVAMGVDIYDYED